MSVFIIILAVGCLFAGWEAAYLFNWAKARRQVAQEEKALRARAEDENLSKTMESALKTIDDCNRMLNPPHSPYCECAYCEIAHGPIVRRDLEVGSLQFLSGSAAHPDYVKSMQEKVDGLKAENRKLRNANMMLQKIQRDHTCPDCNKSMLIVKRTELDHTRPQEW